MRSVPWWGVISAVAAPVLLVAGWWAAAAVQPQHIDPVTQTVSMLAARNATDRWLMTWTFVVVGACDAVTALALRQAALAGRILLFAGGIAGMLVAASPEPVMGGFSLAHLAWASVGFATLSVWPMAARRLDGAAPWALRPTVGIWVSVITIFLLAWFAVEILTGGRLLGLAERVVGEAQALWPFIAVISCARLSQAALPFRTVSSQLPGQPDLRPDPAERSDLER